MTFLASEPGGEASLPCPRVTACVPTLPTRSPRGSFLHVATAHALLASFPPLSSLSTPSHARGPRRGHSGLGRVHPLSTVTSPLPGVTRGGARRRGAAGWSSFCSAPGALSTETCGLHRNPCARPRLLIWAKGGGPHERAGPQREARPSSTRCRRSTENRGAREGQGRFMSRLHMRDFLLWGQRPQNVTEASHRVSELQMGWARLASTGSFPCLCRPDSFTRNSLRSALAQPKKSNPFFFLCCCFFRATPTVYGGS